jgi:O-antigen/teichoic acid export membrane protein
MQRREDIWARPASRRRAAATHAILGYGAIGVSIVTGIVMVPMYLRHIPVRLYGLWLATGGVIGWLGMLDLGIAGVMGQRMAAAYGRRDARTIGLYYFNGLLLQTVLIGVLMLAAIALCPFLPGWLGATPQEAPLLTRCNLLACLAMGLTIFGYGQKNTADALLRPFVPSMMISVGGVFSVLVMILCFQEDLGLYSLPVGMVSGSTLTVAVTLTYSLRLVRSTGSPLRWDRATMTELLRLSPAMLVGKAGNALVGRIEPTLISSMMRPEDAVAFSVTRRAADIVQIMMDRVLGSVVAGFGRHVAEGNRERSAGLVSRIVSVSLTVGMIALAVYLFANASFVALWLGPKFFAGHAVTTLVALSVMALVFNNVYSCLLGATGDMARPALAGGLEAVTRFTLMAALLRVIGMAGAPLAVGISSGAFTVWLYLRLRRRLPPPDGYDAKQWRWKVVCAVGTIGASTALGVFWRADHWWSLTLTASICLILVATIWLPLDPTVRQTWQRQAQRLRS